MKAIYDDNSILINLNELVTIRAKLLTQNEDYSNAVATGEYLDENSIYRGYVGCVQRIQGRKAAVLMDSHTPWDKMITFKLSELKEQTEGFQYYPKKKK